ncbi:MAG TPA: SDR family oxidoreductase [Myxococcaceae bacterium]|nr:SDR family oxidoreductase [Myxococcaceae bacterium]
MTNKIAVITGTSSGFGLLTAMELAKGGFRVVATMRDLSRRERLDKAAQEAGVAGSIDVRRADVTEHDTLSALVDGVVRDYGRVDALVNNAGFAVAGFIEDLSLDEIRKQFETNFWGHVALTKAALPVMRQQRSGHIIMVSSITGLHGAITISSYAASKWALEGWSESLRLEMNALGVKVVVVEPGSYQTDIWTRGAHLGQKLLDGTAVNRERGEKMRARVQAMPKRDPIAVARLIARIAADPNPRLRYVVGPDAHIQLWLKRVLPWKWHEKLMAKLLRID